jgi:acyl dehydratase
MDNLNYTFHFNQQDKDNWTYTFSFTQQDVETFAQITGDTNPIHLDEHYAKSSIFKKRIIHGALSNSVFSRVFGTIHPGFGTIYLSQNTKFIAPMYVDTEYTALFEVTNRKDNGILTVKTEIIDKQTNQLTITGEAVIKI